MSEPWLPYTCRGCFAGVEIRGRFYYGLPDVRCSTCGAPMRRVFRGGAVDA